MGFLNQIMSSAGFGYANLTFCMLFFLLTSVAGIAAGNTLLGFDVSNASIPISAIQRGGPPPDGIPSIDNPQFSRVPEVGFLKDEDLVVGVVHGDDVRAYPFRILIWHEIVNDVVGGIPVAVTYCPLCGTAMAVERRIGNRVLTFGVSGLLYNSDVLMFDRETRSLWSQLGLEAVAGKHGGKSMKWLPSEQMNWATWKERYPDSKVLNTDTGHRRDYINLPYGSYFSSPGTMFPYAQNRADLEPKTWVAGVRHGGVAKAYPLGSLPTGEMINDSIGGEVVEFRYDTSSDHFEIFDASTGEPIPVVHVFWFAWQAFYPETEIYRVDAR